MKHAAVIVVASFLSVCSFVGGYTYAQEKKPAPLSAEMHTKIVDQQKIDLIEQTTQDAIQRRYDQLRDADPEWQKSVAKKATADGILQKLWNEATKGVDPKEWILDVVTLDWDRPAAEGKK